MSYLKYAPKTPPQNISHCRFEEHKTETEEDKSLVSLAKLRQLFFVSTLFYVFVILKQLRVNFFGTISRATGKFARLRIPKFILTPLLKIYSAVYGVNLNEMEIRRLRDFNSFNAFFTRKLQAGIRAIDDENDKFSICSPCDGTVFNYGDCEEDTFVVVKETPYRMDEFLLGSGPDSESRFSKISKKVKKNGNSLKFVLFYLSPGDYHRYHSPAEWTTDFRRHIPGKLYPVKPSYVQNHPNVFKENERVALLGQWANGFFSSTFIGATNVGSIVINFDKDLKTNMVQDLSQSIPDMEYSTLYSDLIPNRNKLLSKSLSDDVIDTQSESEDNETSSLEIGKECSTNVSSPKSATTPTSFDGNSDSEDLDKDKEFRIIEAEQQSYTCSKRGVHLDKAQEIGFFNLGSSIMLIFEASKEAEFEIEVGQKVQLGNRILKVNNCE